MSIRAEVILIPFLIRYKLSSMSSYLLILLLILLQLSCAQVGTSENIIKANHHLKIGTAHMKKGNYPSAMSSFLKAVELDNKNPIIHHNLGIAYFVRNKFTLAEDHIRQAIKISPNYTEARITLGKLLIETGLFEKAIKELRIAERDLTYKSPYRIQFNLGLAFFRIENYELAENYLKVYLRSNEENCLAHNLYGRSLFFQRKYDLSAQVFDRAQSQCDKGTNEDYLYYSAISYYYSGRRGDTIERLERLLNKYPQSNYANHVKTVLKKVQ